MRLRTLLAGAAGAVGVTAIANRVLASRSGEFEPFLPGDHGTYRWRGFDVAYAEAGDSSDPDLLLFHGIHAAASNHEFGPVFESLAEDYHVLAPDLPGFGHSDRPPLLYSASLYESFVADAIQDLAADEPTVVASSVSGAYAAAAATESADVAELVLIGPTADTMGNHSTAVRTLLRSPLVGEALFNLVVAKPSLRHFHADHGYFDMANLAPETLAYEWQTAHQPGARFAPASFVSGFLDPEGTLGARLERVSVPLTLVWGREGDITPLSVGRDLAEQADARLVVFDRARLLPHVEHPSLFVDTLRSTVEPTA